MSTQQQETESLAVIVQQKPEIVLLDREKGEQFYLSVKAEVEAFAADVTTEKGRKAIAALAFKVARTKTAIDDAGKELNAKLREQIGTVDASRRDIREKFDALKEQARRPLTEWEQAEEGRKNFCAVQIGQLKSCTQLLPTDTSDTVRELLEAVRATEPDRVVYGEFFDEAQAAKAAAIESLAAAFVRLKQQEADAAELAELREAKRIRDEQAAEAERLAEEARAKEARAAEAAAKKAERDRIESERAQAEAERLERAKEEARTAALLAAQEARDTQEREHAAALERQRVRMEAEERERVRLRDADLLRQERERIARENTVRMEAEKAELDKVAREKKLLADKKHRATVINHAKAALVIHAEISEDVATAVMRAIVDEKITAVSVRFV